MRALCLALVMLSGCGVGYDPEAPMRTRCEVGPIIETEWESSCELLAGELELAQRILVARGLTTREEMTQAFTGLPIRAFDTRSLACEEEVAGVCTRNVWGLHHVRWPAQWIELERTGRKLAHELLHQLQATRGEVTGHTGWEESGFAAADTEFERLHSSWR